VFKKEPTAADVCNLLSRAVRRAGRAPRYIVSDRSSQFQSEYRDWCEKAGVRPRFAAIGRHGSIAIIERFILSLKCEFLRRLVVPSARSELEALLGAYQVWYNEHRPHAALDGRTPAEVYSARPAKRDLPRFEPRPRFPIARARSNVRRVARLELVVRHVGANKLLPIVELREAA
jgi:transposase InsO family protein